MINIVQKARHLKTAGSKLDVTLFVQVRIVLHFKSKSFLIEIFLLSLNIILNFIDNAKDLYIYYASPNRDDLEIFFIGLAKPVAVY